VFVNTRPGEVVPGSLRVGWLAQLHPTVTVVEVDHDLPTDFSDQELWLRWMALFRARWPHPDGPHAVFSSDGYVGELADRFGATPVVIDPDREAVPISATAIRRSPAEHLEYLAPPVRAWVEAAWLQ
jgi:hypothetical protein